MDEEGLAIVCSTLGNFQENGRGQDVYVKHEDCLESLKDLQRYMRRDHPESRDIFVQLGKWNVVRRDIVPLIVRYSDDHELVLHCVKVLVFLTMPIEPSSNQASLQIEYLQHFRAALLDDDTIPVIMSLLEEPLQHLERGAPKEDDWKMLQLFLTLLRNLLAIPDSFTHHISASTQFAYLKERLLEILFNESVMELVVALTQHTAGRHGGLRNDNFLILEILHHILTGQRPDLVAAAADKNFKVQKLSEKSSETLRALMYEEKAQLKYTRHDPALHTPFSGMFVRVAQDGTKTILTRTPHQSPLENLLRKPQIKRGPIKRVVPENHSVRPINDHLQVLLKDFVNQFLASGYNVLMQTIKDDIRRERPENEAIDPVPFFQVVQFFTGYLCRIAQKEQANYKQSSSSSEAVETEMPPQKHICGSIASTLDEDMFVLVRSKWCQYIDEAQTSKDWGPVAAGVAVMKDMIQMLDIILKRSGPMNKDGSLELRTARILVYKVFYDQTETGILQTVLSLLKRFDIHKQSRSFLADLVEIIHIVLRILEDATKEGSLRVLQKARRVRKKAKAAVRKAEENLAGPGDVKLPVAIEGDLDEMISKSVDSLGQEPAGIAETENSLADGVGVCEGPQEALAEGLTDIFTAGNTEDWGENAEVVPNPVEIVQDDDSDDDDDLESMTKEVSLDVKQLVSRRLADNTIVRNYCWLLKYYGSNSVTTNYYVVRMLQRICEDRVLEPMLYQLSIFQTFYTILSDMQLYASKDHKFVVAFLTKVVRGFFKKLKDQPMLYVELLFWKLKHECHNISADYMIHKLKRAVGGSSNGNGQQRINISDALGDDEDSAPHARAQDGNDGSGAESDEQESSENDDQPDSPASSGCSPLSADHEEQMKELFFKFKTEHDFHQLIALQMAPSSVVTPEQVMRYLRSWGLVERPRKAKRRRTSMAGEANDNQQLGPGESRKLKRKSVDSANGAESRKRKKSTLFNESQDEELRKLFERHGSSRKCSRTIAEAIGGEFTPAQISRRLLTLGLVRSKPKSKLEAFLANVKDCEENGDSEEENADEDRARNKPSSSPKTSSLCQSDDVDDDAPLGSIFKIPGPSGEASNLGNQVEEGSSIEPSQLDLRASIGRGARQKKISLKGKEIVGPHDSDDDLPLSMAAPRRRPSDLESGAVASTSKSAVTEMDHPTEEPPSERVPDNWLSEDEGTRKDGGAKTTLLDFQQPPSNAEILASGLHASWGANERKRPQTEENHGDVDKEAENTTDGLRAPWGPTARRKLKSRMYEEAMGAENLTASPGSHAREEQPPGIEREADGHDNSRHAEELVNVALPNDTTEDQGSDWRPSDPLNDGESSQRKLSKRRRLAKKLARPEVSEEENQEEAAKLSSQEAAPHRQVITDEALEDDGMFDF